MTTITIRCPNPACGHTKVVPDGQLGKCVRCEQCGTPVRESLERIGRFEIRGKLGSGAFGTVYRAYDSQLDRDVALKIPHADRIADENVLKRFLNEAKAAARLQHPQIIPVFDAGREGDRYFLASALIEGEPLDSVLARGVPEYHRTARIVMQLAEGLAYAHRQGILHRDVKPANILIDQDDEPHLLDFGLARLEESDERLTQDGAILGTPAYMPPEQARGETAAVGPASDQYSLGVTLYEMLCGRLPFRGPVRQVVLDILHRDPPAPGGIDPEIPRDLEVVCLKAMARDAADRYPTCRELADDLRRSLMGVPISARPTSWHERTVKWARRNPLISGLVSALAVILLFATWQFASTRKAVAVNELDAQRRRRTDYRNQLEEAQRMHSRTEIDALEAIATGEAGSELGWEWYFLYVQALREQDPDADRGEYGESVIEDVAGRLFAWNSDGGRLAAIRRVSGSDSSRQTSLGIWDVAGVPTLEWELPADRFERNLEDLRSIHWSSNDRWLACHWTDAVEIWDVAVAERTITIEPTQEEWDIRRFQSVSWDPHHARLAVLESDPGQEAVIRFFITDRTAPQREFYHSQLSEGFRDRFPDDERMPQFGIRWSPDGTRMAGGDVIWDPETGATLDALPLIERYEERYSEGSLSYVRSLSYREQVEDSAWSPDGRNLAFVSDSRLGIWDTEARELLASESPVERDGLEWHPSGERIVAGGEMRDALTLDVMLGFGGAFSPAGDALAANASGTLVIWNPWKADVGAAWPRPILASGDRIRIWLHHRVRPISRVLGSILLFLIGSSLLLQRVGANRRPAVTVPAPYTKWLILIAFLYSSIGFALDSLIQIPFDNVLVQLLSLLGALALLQQSSKRKRTPAGPVQGHGSLAPRWSDNVLNMVARRVFQSQTAAKYLESASTRIGIACVFVAVVHWGWGHQILI